MVENPAFSAAARAADAGKGALLGFSGHGSRDPTCKDGGPFFQPPFYLLPEYWFFEAPVLFLKKTNAIYNKEKET